MKIKKVVIDNFKSIDHIELDFDKVGDSFTKIFVGINESGKSNILEALSYFKAPEEKVSFDNYCNQKFDEKKCCEMSFYLEMDDNNLEINNLLDEKGKACKVGFIVSDLIKKVTLLKGRDKFEWKYEYRVSLKEKDVYIRSEKGYDSLYNTIEKYYLSKEKKDGYILLTQDKFKSYFGTIISDAIKKVEPEVSVWKPSQEYMLTNVNLNSFAKNINSNKPLRNIFYLSGYTDQKSIIDTINKVNIPKNRSILTSKLNSSINNYINRVWNNKINILIEITETGSLSFLIKDQGADNEHNRFDITERSQGAQQFLYLILSLSLESESHERKNELILIDEPEVHLHPSGIRDLGKELLKVGNENYVFMATHSPFIIDKSHKERHYIVKKNKKAITEIKRIKESDNIIDDEVLNEAFGINVYQDLLNPHSILVEGSSDKVILQKVLVLLGRKDIGITNGHGANIDTLASKMNFDNISVLVIVDDDKDGQRYKEKILKIEGVYNDKNVFTIRDIEGTIVNEGTIEDTLGKEYVKSQFQAYYKGKYGVEPSDFELDDAQPVLSQIIVFLKKKKQYSEWDLDAFKKQVSDNYNPTKSSLEKKSKQLKSLAEKIIEKLK